MLSKSNVTKEQNKIAQRQLRLMEKGFSMGKYTFNREEIHERKNTE